MRHSLLLFGFLLAPLCSGAQKFYSTLSWSPDGKRLLVAQETWVGEQGTYTQLSMSADGTDVRVIAENALGGVWLPDGNRIAFSRDGELFISNPDGSGARQLTKDTVRDIEPSFSPDGNHMSFTSVRGKKGIIFIMNTDGSGRRKVAEGYTSSWSPSGKQLVYYKDKGDSMDKVYVFDLSWATEHLITKDSLDNYYPSWTPDGKIIYSFADRIHKQSEVSGLCSIKADGTDRERIGTIKPWFARMAPDGTKIAYTKPNPNFNGSHVILIDLVTGQEWNLTK